MYLSIYLFIYLSIQDFKSERRERQWGKSLDWGGGDNTKIHHKHTFLR